MVSPMSTLASSVPILRRRGWGDWQSGGWVGSSPSMPGRFTTHLISRTAGRVPGLRRLPIFKLFMLAEVALLARDQLGRLDPTERRRLVELVRQGRGRSRNLGPEERKELAVLVAKVEPRAFAGQAIDRLSPVPLPKRLVHGPPKR